MKYVFIILAHSTTQWSRKCWEEDANVTHTLHVHSARWMDSNSSETLNVVCWCGLHEKMNANAFGIIMVEMCSISGQWKLRAEPQNHFQWECILLLGTEAALWYNEFVYPMHVLLFFVCYNLQPLKGTFLTILIQNVSLISLLARWPLIQFRKTFSAFKRPIDQHIHCDKSLSNKFIHPLSAFHPIPSLNRAESPSPFANRGDVVSWL